MNFDFTSFILTPGAPWAVACAVLLMAAIYLVTLLRKNDNALDQKNQAIEQLEKETLVLAERIKSRESELENAVLGHKDQVQKITEERDLLRNALQQEQRNISELKQQSAATDSRLRAQLDSASEKLVLLEQAEERLHANFENLANRIFDEKHQKFNEASKTSVEALLKPMRQQIGDFRKRVDEVYDKENEQRTTLRAEISQLKNLNERISADALNLTNALKGDSKVRGNWGEVQLELLLEQSGLKKGREYEVQASFKNEEGKRYQPDVIVHLPENKDVVIDAKVSLVAYEAYHSCKTDEDRVRYLKQHLDSIRTHINQLSSKSYDELVGLRSLDLVIMFVPIEPALLLALEHDPGLYNEAYNKRIVLVSPTLLMATLQIINNIWRYEDQNRNAQTIADAASRLYDQFVLFTEALDKVGDHIKKAGDSYDLARKRLVDGKGNLVGRIQKLQDLGVKPKKSIARELLDQAEIEDGRPAPVEKSDSLSDSDSGAGE